MINIKVLGNLWFLSEGRTYIGHSEVYTALTSSLLHRQARTTHTLDTAVRGETCYTATLLHQLRHFRRYLNITEGHRRQFLPATSPVSVKPGHFSWSYDKPVPAGCVSEWVLVSAPRLALLTSLAQSISSNGSWHHCFRSKERGSWCVQEFPWKRQAEGANIEWHRT